MNEISRIIQKEGLKMTRHRCGLRRRRNIEAHSVRYKDTCRISFKMTENTNSYDKDKKNRLKLEQEIKKTIKKTRKEESRRNLLGTRNCREKTFEEILSYS